MVTPKRVVETTPLVVAQTERLKRSLEIVSRTEATRAPWSRAASGSSGSNDALWRSRGRR
jgi:hypothetical protein